MRRFIFTIVIITIPEIAFPQESLDNGILHVEFNATPAIASIHGKDTGATVYSAPAPNAAANSAWKQVPDPVFHRAEASLPPKDGLQQTLIAELAPESAWLRLHTRIANTGDSAKPIPQFSIAALTGDFPGAHDAVRYWEALAFGEKEQPLSKDTPLVLGSRLHSSDTRPKGQNPWWVFTGPEARVYFGLTWCGGWRAEIAAGNITALLPPEETQLTLAPGESMDGPILSIFFPRANTDREARREWFLARAALGAKLLPGPAPAFPFTYNNWYTTRFDFDGAFLRGQQEALAPYAFDYVIVDAGWYEACGQWRPDPNKFAPGEFEGILADIKNAGVKIGIWSCPQFVRADANALPPEVDQPGFYRKFIDGWLLDYAGMDFTKFLLDHVAALRANYSMDWWKYDQDFFTESTRHGVMKNVVALQNALTAVRLAQPDLVIEDCQSGGRMLNDFTAMLAQTHWIRDGGNTGLEHARSNLRESLGALEILPPWGVNRWLNNPDQNDPEDDEFMRMYCRASMCGTWGLVADLRKIVPRQRDVIVKEVANYRRLNALKAACRYDILPCDKGANAAGIVYYNAEGTNAGVLLFRWETRRAFKCRVPLDGLAEGVFAIHDVDTGADSTAPSKEALQVIFPKERKSALLFLDKTGS